MKPRTQCSLALTAFAVSALIGWLANRPATADQIRSPGLLVSTAGTSSFPRDIQPAAGNVIERSEPPKLIPPKTGGKWFAVAPEAFDPGHPMRCGSGLGVHIFDEITPGSDSAEQWAAA